MSNTNAFADMIAQVDKADAARLLADFKRGMLTPEVMEHIDVEKLTRQILEHGC